jgi:glycosyltransferase involved in cell wall biosynthesis
MTHLNLRVGLVGPAPPPNGGMAMQTQQLATLLAKENVQVIRLVTNAPYKPKCIEKIKGVRAVFRLIPYLLDAWRLAGRVDVIHIMANSGWSWQLFSAPVVWTALARGTPVIVNYRGGEAMTYFGRSFSQVRPTLKRASRVVVPSLYLKEVFNHFLVESVVIPNIIDQELFYPNLGEKSNNTFTVIVTRNLEPIYGLEHAIRAVAILKGKIDGLELKIAGSGPQLDELRSLAGKLEVNDIVEFVGRIERKDMCAFYHSSHVMLNPTTVDNMPNSVLEALACAVPVISTAVGGVPYIVEHDKTALLVDSGSPEQMADAILRLYEHPAIGSRLADSGLAEVAQYGWEKVRDRWLELYRLTTAESNA